MESYFKHYQKSAIKLLQRFGDVRFTGQILFGVIVVLISWSGVKTVQTNYGLQKQISGLRQQNAVQQLANNNLKLQNEYYNTQQFLDLSARQDFGLADPGETEVLVPREVALANTVNVPQLTASSPSQTKQSAYQSNIQSWLNFFLHRQQSTD